VAVNKPVGDNARKEALASENEARRRNGLDQAQ
jgi:hypothetical protein